LGEGLVAVLVAVARVDPEALHPAPEVFVALVETTAPAVAGPAQQATQAAAIKARHLLWEVRAQALARTQEPSKRLRCVMLFPQ